MSISLPRPVGEVSAQLLAALSAGAARSAVLPTAGEDPFDHDLQLGLYVLNELHYAGWAGVDDSMEWDPIVTASRLALGQEFERRLRA